MKLKKKKTTFRFWFVDSKKNHKHIFHYQKFWVFLIWKSIYFINCDFVCSKKFFSVFSALSIHLTFPRLYWNVKNFLDSNFFSQMQYALLLKSWIKNLMCELFSKWIPVNIVNEVARKCDGRTRTKINQFHSAFKNFFCLELFTNV